MAVLFISTVIAVTVSIADQRLDAIAIGAPEQTPETDRVSGDAVGLVGAAQAVGFSVANGGFRDAAPSSPACTLELALFTSRLRLIGGALCLVGAVKAIKQPVAPVLLADAGSIAASKSGCRTGTTVRASVLIRPVAAIVSAIAHVSRRNAKSICALECLATARNLCQFFCLVLGWLAVKFIGTVGAVRVSIADVLRLDAVAIGAPEQIPETRRVASDAVRLVGAVETVRFSVANVRLFHTDNSTQSSTLELEGSTH